MDMKKTTALLLALLLLLPLFAGCSEKSAEKPETQAAAEPSAGTPTEAAAAEEETETTILDTLPTYDFGGGTVRTMAKEDSWWQYIDLYVEEITGEIINDSIYNRNLAFETKYNAEFVIDHPSSVLTSTRQAVTAGDASYDFVVPSLTDGSQLALEDSLFDLKTISGLDLSNRAWDQNANYWYSVCGKLYYGVSDISLGKNECAWIYMFNKNLLNQYQMESPYDLVREGKWTLDKTLEMMNTASADLNGSGEPDAGDMYGLATHNVNYYALIVSGGQPVTVKDNEDIPHMNIDNEAFVDIYDYIAANFVDKSKTVMEYEGETFIDGHALLCGQVMACVRLFREMEDDFGIVPTPKRDEAQEKYYSYLIPYDVYACCIPISAADPERSGTAMQALAIYSADMLTPAYYEITITGKGLRDPDSAEMLDLILDSALYDLGRLYNWGDFANSLPGNIESKINITTAYKRKAKAIEKEVEKTVNTIQSNNN